jgi:hypothetical protein
VSLFNQDINTNTQAIVTRISLYLSLTALVSCSTEQAKVKVYSEPLPLSNEIIFDCFSINHAWGYQMSGFYIDRQGMVYRYKRKGAAWHPKAILLEKQRYYEVKDLAAKFTEKSWVARMDSASLQSKIALIDTADSGSVTRAKQKGADAGQSLCLAYRYGKDKNLYQPVALGSYGATKNTIVNNSPKAQSLLKWLIYDIANRITHTPQSKGHDKATR